jgi:hypothetical protein
MTLPVVLKSIFGKLFGIKTERNTVIKPTSERQIFLPLPTGGFATISRRIWESPFEKLNDKIAQIHTVISRSAISPNSPLMRIFHMLERLFRTIFLPLELMISSVFLPLMPILRFLINVMFRVVMPYAISFFKFMINASNTIENALKALLTIGSFFGFENKEQKDKKKDENQKQKTLWDLIVEGIGKLLGIGTAEAATDGSAPQQSTQTTDKVKNPIVEFFDKINAAFTQHPIATQIYELVVTKVLFPTVDFINKFNRAFVLHPFALQIYEYTVTKMLLPVIDFINKFNHVFSMHPFALQIYEIVVTKTILPVVEFINKFNNAIVNHPVVIGINQLIQQNIINPIVEFIAKISSKFNEINNSIPAKINEINIAINNLIDNIKSRISALASSVTIGSLGGGGSSGNKTSYGSIPSHTIPQPKRSGPAYPLQHGGLLLEPIFAVGLMTGRRYTLAEKQPELVVPVEKSSGVNGVVININVNGNIIGINDFENRIKQIIETELRRVR